ncbi:MAG: hypothetical protein VB076_05000, partial [Synergistaceae bacterium]|nr:hypothetical protein [Synergistaceae bacterium]
RAYAAAPVRSYIQKMSMNFYISRSPNLHSKVGCAVAFEKNDGGNLRDESRRMENQNTYDFGY